MLAGGATDEIKKTAGWLVAGWLAGCMAPRIPGGFHEEINSGSIQCSLLPRPAASELAVSENAGSKLNFLETCTYIHIYIYEHVRIYDVFPHSLLSPFPYML